MNQEIANLITLGERLLKNNALIEAENCLKKVLDHDPSNARAYCLLGAVAMKAGMFDVAVELLLESISNNPKDEQAYNYLASILNGAKRYSEAVEIYKKGLETLPESAVLMCGLGLLYVALGSFSEAEEILRRASEREPDSADCHGALGSLYLEKEMLNEAIKSFIKAIELEPDNVTRYYDYAQVFVKKNQWDKALEIYEMAYSIDSSYLPLLMGMGELFSEKRRENDALYCYRRVLEIDAKEIDAAYQLVDMKREEGLLPYLELLKKWLQNGGESWFTPEKKCTAYYVLGKHEENLGNNRSAFEYYAKGATALDTKYDRKNWEQAVEASERCLTEKFFLERTSYGCSSNVPLFVVGMPRSGTTLVESILSSHSKIDTIGESELIDNLSNTISKIVGVQAEYPENLLAMTDERCRLYGELYLHSLIERGASGEKSIDKTPGNFMHLGFIALMFPNARIVYCKRNPLDVAVSCYSIRFAHGLEWSYDLDDIVHMYKLHERIMKHWEKVLPLQIYTVQYEELIDNPEQISRELVEFCGYEWEPQCLEFYKNKRVVRTASADQVRRPIYKSSKNRWRNYADMLGPVIRAFPEWT